MTIGYRVRTLPLGILAALAVWQSACADDPADIRFITATRATSACIGEPKTPLCAIDTWNTCNQREDPTLCSVVGFHKMALMRTCDQAEPWCAPAPRREYRIVSITTITEEMLQGTDASPRWYRSGPRIAGPLESSDTPWEWRLRGTRRSAPRHRSVRWRCRPRPDPFWRRRPKGRGRRAREFVLRA